MIGKRDRAIHALQPLTASPAGDDARKTAPVQQQHGLLAVVQTFTHRVQQRARKRGLFAGFQKLAPHVDDGDGRHGPLLDAPRQLQTRVLPALGVVAAFQTGRGRPQNDHGALVARPHHRYVAAVIARGVLLLIALVVFFVYDDQPQVLNGREHAGPGGDYHGGLTGANPPPLLGAFGVLKGGMQDGNPFAETVVELSGDGRGQRDLGYQQERAAA
jgi:hypothetical protein